MDLKMIKGEFTVCKVTNLDVSILEKEFVFFAKTNEELSLVCKNEYVPENTIVKDEGWYCFRIAEDASFDKYGMIAYLANIIAAEKTSTLVIGTYDTDYLFIKREKMDNVKAALIKNGSRFLD